MQEVGFWTLSTKEVNNDLTSFNIVLPIASVTQGALFCKAATGPNNAACAAVPAFFAIAVFFVAATTLVNTPSYNTSKPELNFGLSEFIALFVKFVVKPFDKSVILLVADDNNFNFSVALAIFDFLIVFFNSALIEADVPVPPNGTHSPIISLLLSTSTSELPLSIFFAVSLSTLRHCGFVHFVWSPVEFASPPLDETLTFEFSVFNSGAKPEKGLNGDSASFIISVVLPITPNMTGC